jgi:hypothetical protein
MKRGRDALCSSLPVVALMGMLVVGSLAHAATTVSGTWKVKFNNSPGTMEITGTPGSYQGRLTVDGSPEKLLDLMVTGNSISFRRGVGDQRYQGSITGNAMSGTFTQGGAGRYPWVAELASPQKLGDEKGGNSSRSGSPTTQPGPKPATPPPAARVIFDNWNKGGVSNGPLRVPSFTLGQSTLIASILNYHWNNGRGQNPGTIALVDVQGRIFGPWPAAGTSGTGGAVNVNWKATPNLTLPAGNYLVYDSDPATWSHNSASNGTGFSLIQ